MTKRKASFGYPVHRDNLKIGDVIENIPLNTMQRRIGYILGFSARGNARVRWDSGMISTIHQRCKRISRKKRSKK